MGVLAIVFLVLVCMVLSCGVFYGRKPVRRYVCGDKNCPECGNFRPGDAERPTLPPPIIVHLAVSDRLERRDRATPEEREGLRVALARIIQDLKDQKLVEDAIRDLDPKEG